LDNDRDPTDVFEDFKGLKFIQCIVESDEDTKADFLKNMCQEYVYDQMDTNDVGNQNSVRTVFWRLALKWLCEVTGLYPKEWIYYTTRPDEDNDENIMEPLIGMRNEFLKMLTWKGVRKDYDVAIASNNVEKVTEIRTIADKWIRSGITNTLRDFISPMLPLIFDNDLIERICRYGKGPSETLKQAPFEMILAFVESPYSENIDGYTTYVKGVQKRENWLNTFSTFTQSQILCIKRRFHAAHPDKGVNCRRISVVQELL
jgi:hypothetical protein